MTEKEYIRATNLSKIRAMLSLLRDVMDGDEYGVRTVEKLEAYRHLFAIEERLNKSIRIEGE